MAFLAPAAPANAADKPCARLNGNEQAENLIASVNNNFRCALLLHALRLVVQNPESLARLKAAYAKARTENPDKAAYVDEMSEMVDAVAGHPEAILARYDRNVAAKPDDPGPKNTACWIRAKFGIQLDVALKLCDTAVAGLSSGPRKQPGTFANRAKVKLLLGDYAGAKNDYNEALNEFQAIAGNTTGIASFMLESLYGRGVARIHLGDTAGGKDDMRKATNMYPPIADDFTDLGIKP